MAFLRSAASFCGFVRSILDQQLDPALQTATPSSQPSFAEFTTVNNGQTDRQTDMLHTELGRYQ